MKWKFFRVSQASSKTLRQFFIPCIEATLALVRLSRDGGLRKWGRPKLPIVVVPVRIKKAVNLACAMENDMRRDLENEDNERIATILSHDYGLVSVRQFSKEFMTNCVSEVGMGESGTQVGENDMRGDLENEDNGRIAILAHDEVVTGRQFNEVGTSLWGSSQGEVGNVNSGSGSSEQLESFEPAALVAGTVDSQEGSFKVPS